MVAIAVKTPGVLDLFDPPAGATPGPGEVRLSVKRAGICGSDIHIFHGSNPFAKYPRIIGHEFAGRVTEVGPGVTGISVGDQVVADPVVSCGVCYPCRIGRSNVCGNLQVIGVHRDGGFRDEVVLPSENCVKAPSELPAGVAALAEPFAVAANVLARTGVSAEDVVMIYGAGTVGLTVLQVAKLHGARVIISDIDDSRLQRARSFGADATLNSKRESVPEAVASENDGLGPTVVIDGAGLPALLEEACRIASPAGRIGLLGFSPAPCNVSQQEIVKKELTLVGSRLNRRFIPQVVRWLAEGRLRPEAMITQVFPASQARAAFELIESDPSSTIKVQLAFGE
ncbi:Zn-dependent oxidoreductase [Alsobacter soli]|uniref:Zn-dependent oxidoreductase n=1 Tax=Alsobacter soli TaxID=2109933 RepID=A0A2T1HR96_9HYPH|nr:Zn-dependent oxidoreductase [Alsobacter soli]PSC04184.1 Zn-dependent oxidoreductase [Alsobacter soli]